MLRISRAAMAACCLLSSLFAQGVAPVGQVHSKALPLASVATLAVPALDRAAIAEEDARRRNNLQPARYAMPFAVDASPSTHGTWEVLDNTWSLWRLRIQAPNASHVNLGFDQFFMPAGGRLMVYSSNYTDIVRPFDAADHAPSGQLWTPVVGGEEIVAEVYLQTTSRPQLQLHLVQVGSGYRFFGAGADALGLDIAGSCNVDVACPQGAAWASEIPAVAAISSGGSIFCTGCMINDVAQDQKNYFLTANHCGVTAGVAPSLVCYWNYKNATCGAGPFSLSQFNTGAVLRAGYATSDFTLVELNNAPNPAWGVSYAGWDRSTGTAASAVCIHHPQGDVKKISFDNTATQTTSYGGTASPGNSSHVRVVSWNVGTTEPGSSGSPLFNPSHQIIGQLHGGGAACGNTQSDWFGRLALSWTGGGSNSSRLSNWLDPLNTGVTSVNTLVPGAANVASAIPYGVGCYTTYGAFAQTFAANTFDLGGTAVTTNSLLFTPTANGYSVAVGANTWFTPASANLGLGDDALVTVNLPFTFSYPGGSATALRMCSNGFAWLGSTATDTSYMPAAADLAGGAARFAPLWMDLNPTAGGTTNFDVEPGNTAVYLTWNGVPHYTTGTTGPGNYGQLVLRSNGQVEYRWRQVPNQINTALVGWSRGAVSTPADIDISASLPISVSLDSAGLAFTPVNRPILGTTQTIHLANIAAPASSIGLAIVGFTQVLPGIDLVTIGAPGCLLYAPATVIQTVFPLAGVTSPWGLAIPSTGSLNGTHVYCQGALLVPPGTNAFGLLTANGVDLKLGTL